ncbi:hypothetical protein M947_08785 [Sulfurimonas hongkongensis]|uniref:Uncharacterized protein n=2 Tax=Sulfurimonas hongkongensis TaxID=1172190 RepID=T0KQ10_9BACT|nr:hypothetical protein M947_08785 [Sulfurimonas hongkongensis]
MIMAIQHKNITPLLEFVKIDRFYVVCHFKCKVTNKTVISTVPFEPYDGKIEISWQDMLLRPIESYNRYYHTPITIYNHDCQDTVVLKAFEKVSKYFEWNENFGSYVYIEKKGLEFEQKVS